METKEIFASVLCACSLVGVACGKTAEDAPAAPAPSPGAQSNVGGTSSAPSASGGSNSLAGEGGDGRATGAVEDSSCPGGVPAPRTPCGVEGVSCLVPLGCCGDTVAFSCENGTWELETEYAPDYMNECTTGCDDPLATCTPCPNGEVHRCVRVSCYSAPQFRVCSDDRFVSEADYCEK